MDIIKDYTYYVDAVKEKFPTLSESEIKVILRHGFRMFAGCNMNDLDTLHMSKGFVAYVGKFFNDGLKYHHYWRTKYKKKARYLYRRRKTIYDGYYYFALTEKEYQFYLSQKKPRGTRRQKFFFPYIYAYKVKEEAFVDRFRKYFFRLSFPTDVGWTLYKENWETRRAELFAYRDNNGDIQYI